MTITKLPELTMPERLPISPAQRRLWLLDQLHPQTSAYNVVRAFRLDGRLDVRMLEASFRNLLRRHESLTATFASDSEGPYRQIADHHDGFAIQKRSTDERALAQALGAEAARPFDLSKGPLLRAALFAVGDHHVLLVVLHQAVADEPSAEILLSELAAEYEALVTPGASPVSSIGHPDSMSDEHDVVDSVRFVSGYLAGMPEHLDLPTVRARPVVFNYRGALENLTLDAQLSRAIQKLADMAGVEVFIVLLTAFKLLLGRYANQTDIVVGIPERQADRHSRVGSFDSTLVVRTAFEDELTFTEALRRVAASHRSARSHGGIPFQTLLDALNPARDRSRTPVFQASFALRELLSPGSAGAPVGWSRIDVHSGGARTDLALDLHFENDAIEGFIEYASDLFDAEMARSFAGSLQTLLESIVKNPNEQVSRLRIVHPDEEAHLARINGTAQALPDARGFDELIARQAERAPDRIAVVSEKDSLTYRELEERSRALAATLERHGIGRGARVGVLLERSAALVPAVLGVAKSGAAYVPLDPDYPRDRIAYMVEDARLAAIVTDGAMRNRVSSGTFAIIDLDSVPNGAPAPAGGVTTNRASTDIAYVIYTSGSTGRPKGVQVPHGAVVNFLMSMASEPGCRSDDRIVAVTTLSFDIAVLELFLPLSVGASTYVASRHVSADGAALGKLLEQFEATMMQATPTTWRLLVEAGFRRKGDFRALCGGEALPAALARELLPRVGQLWNMYGPTETTVWSTCHRITDLDAPILIGHPIANTEVYVLDRHKAPVPLGVTGELYIAGDGVTAGYLDRPELTEDRFVPNPWSPGERMYRTGDSARMTKNGLVFMGRNDGQIKLRGHRIEIGEIESVIGTHAGVGRCAVEVREFGPGDARIVAFVVAKGKTPVDAGEVRALARTRLPEYMVPQHVVELATFPLTPNGKIDRKALATPKQERAAGTPTVAARSATEELLAGIWRDVLGTQKVGVTDNFFDVGGHSLTAVRLVQRINQACQLSLPLSVIFEAPTIAQQAERIDTGRYSDGVSVVALQPTGTEPPLFCICGINLYQSLARNLAPNRPAFGVFLPVEGKILEGNVGELSVREMARDYVSAIRSKQPTGPYYLAGASFGGLLAYEAAQQLRAAGQDVPVLAIMDVTLSRGLRFSRLRWVMDHSRRLAAAGPREAARMVVAGLRAIRNGRLPNGKHPRKTVAYFGDDPKTANVGELNARRQLLYQVAAEKYEREMLPYCGTTVLFHARDELNRVGFIVEPSHGWDTLISGGRHHHIVPGDHLGILEEPNVKHLARILVGLFKRAAAVIPPLTSALAACERRILTHLYEFADVTLMLG